MRVQFDDVIFAYDFDRLTSGGLLYDHGPLALHATPGAGAAAPTRQLDGSYSFDGGDYFALSGDSQTRFYANAPTGAFALLATWTPSTSTTDALFSCDNAGAANWKGLLLVSDVGTTALLYQMQGVGTLPRVAVTSASMSVGKQRSICGTVEATPRGLANDSVATASWALGAFGTAVYDAAQVPLIGQRPSGSYKYTGRISYLCLLRGAVSSADMAELSAMMMNGRKPFAWR